MASKPRYEVIETDDSDVGAGDPPAAQATTSSQGERGSALAIGAITLALRSLTQRSLIALDNLFCLLTVFSVFWLWHSIPDPNVYQLVGLAMYALFVLSANIIVRRK